MTEENGNSSAPLHRDCSPQQYRRAIELLLRIRKAGEKEAFEEGNTTSEVMQDVIAFLDDVFGPAYPFHDD